MIAGKILAGIDIGSNAARLIVNDVLSGKNFTDSVIKKTAYIRLPLRLGGDVFKFGYIGEKRAERFLKGMEIFRELIDFYHVDEFRAVATSAMRNAQNGKALRKEIFLKTGISVEIIDGYQEAELLAGALQHRLPKDQHFLSLDLGGGSLDISLFRNAEILDSQSFKIGTVRYINGLINKQEYKRLEEYLRNIKKKFPDTQAVGSGGNINKISKMIGSPMLKRKQIKKLHSTLAPLNIKERMLQYNLRYDRADVIVPAAEIFLKVLKQFDLKTIHVPQTGIGDAVIYELFAAKN